MLSLSYPQFEEKIIASYSKFIDNKGGNEALHQELICDGLIHHLCQMVKNMSRILPRIKERDSNTITILEFFEFVLGDEFYTLLFQELKERPLQSWPKEEQSLFFRIMEIEYFKAMNYNDLVVRMKKEESVISNFSFYLAFEGRRDKSLKRMTAFKIWLERQPQLQKQLEDCLKFLKERDVR